MQCDIPAGGLHDPTASSRSNAGFALILVLWVTALISLVTATIVVTTRMYVQATAAALANTKAEMLANGGVDLVRFAILSRAEIADPREVPQPIMCTIGNDAIAVVTVENETGKINLNSASLETLAQLFMGLGLDRSRAVMIAREIKQFARVDLGEDASAAASDSGGLPPKGAPFETALELDQLAGMTREIFEESLPFVSARARGEEFDPAAAPANLLAILGGAGHRSVPTVTSPRPGSVFVGLSGGRGALGDQILIHVEVMTEAGGFFVREAIAPIAAGTQRLRVTEWRRGRSRYQEALSSAVAHLPSAEQSLPECWRGIP